MGFSNDGLGFLIADVSRLMRRAFARRIEGSGLTFAQSRALVHVSRCEGVRQVELATLLEVQPITLARLIDQLVAMGLVERRADPHDRRAYRIYLKPAAAAYLQAIRKVGASVRRDVLRDVDSAQADALVRTLSQMRRNLGAGETALDRETRS